MELVVVAVLAELVALVFGDGSVLTDVFHSVRVCNIPISSPQSNAKSTSNKQFCAALCIRNSAACFSFSVHNATGQCYFNSQVLTEDGCVDEFYHFNSELRPSELGCQHDGIYNRTADTCWCINSYVGTRCQRLMTDCSDGVASGFYTGDRDVFTILPSRSPYPIQVYCEMEYGGEMFIMKNGVHLPAVDFNRSWSDYRDGFGDLSGNFWLGLEKMHYITTSRNFILVVEAVMYEEDPEINAGNYRQHFFNNFNVSSESNMFRFTTSGHYSQPGLHVLGDCVTDNVRVPFSTYDNDLSASNCTATSMSGWWFKDCGVCNPTGMLQPNSDKSSDPDPKYAHWPVTISDQLAVRYLKLFLKAMSS